MSHTAGHLCACLVSTALYHLEWLKRRVGCCVSTVSVLLRVEWARSMPQSIGHLCACLVATAGMPGQHKIPSSWLPQSINRSSMCLFGFYGILILRQVFTSSRWCVSTGSLLRGLKNAPVSRSPICLFGCYSKLSRGLVITPSSRLHFDR